MRLHCVDIRDGRDSALLGAIDTESDKDLLTVQIDF